MAGAVILGTDDDLRYLAGRLRKVWPDVHIHVRGDCGFGVPVMYRACEELDVAYTFGIGPPRRMCHMNVRLKRHSEPLLEQAQAGYEQTGQKQRLFIGFWYQADSWDRARYVVLKAEAHAAGTNRRAVVTNGRERRCCRRPPTTPMPSGARARTTTSRQIRRGGELKVGMRAYRLSDPRFKANFFRLYLHTAALKLLVELRRRISQDPSPVSLGVEDPRPAEALPEKSRKRFFNRRRRADPLGQGQPCTWRTQLIKVAAEVTRLWRAGLVRLSASWPHFDRFAAVSGQLLAMPPTPK